MITQWEYPSASSEATHTVTHAENGLLACSCRGWTFMRPRACNHIKDVVLRRGFAVEVRDDYVFTKESDDLTPGAVRNIITESEVTTMATMAVTAAATVDPMKASAMTEAKFARVLDADGYIIPAKFDAVFGTGEWTMDEKLDGHRCQILKVGNSVVSSLKSLVASARNSEEQAAGLPKHIIEEVRKFPFDILLDGEIAVPGGISTDVPNLANRSKLVFLAFDVLAVCGEPCAHLPQVERRALLETAAVHASGSVAVVAQYEPTWANVKAIWARGGEGSILKRKIAVYRPGFRSGDWVKVKRLEHHSVTVTGFETGSFGPTSVVLFRFDDGTDGRCKNRDTDTLSETAAAPAKFIGRRLVVQCQQRIRGKSPRHPMFSEWDHVAGDAE